VTPQQRLFAWIYHLGSIVLVVSICLQIFRRVDALFPAILLVGVTRIGLAAWQLVWPPDAQTDRTRSGLVINIVVWGSVILLLIWARLYGAGT
jgi:uncharacterized membrane protein YphA (DoxX/SURF4 family)